MLDKIGGFLVERAIEMTIEGVVGAFSGKSKDPSEDYDDETRARII